MYAQYIVRPVAVQCGGVCILNALKPELSPRTKVFRHYAAGICDAGSTRLSKTRNVSQVTRRQCIAIDERRRRARRHWRQQCFPATATLSSATVSTRIGGVVAPQPRSATRRECTRRNVLGGAR